MSFENIYGISQVHQELEKAHIYFITDEAATRFQQTFLESTADNSFTRTKTNDLAATTVITLSDEKYKEILTSYLRQPPDSPWLSDVDTQKTKVQKKITFHTVPIIHKSPVTDDHRIARGAWRITSSDFERLVLNQTEEDPEGHVGRPEKLADVDTKKQKENSDSITYTQQSSGRAHAQHTKGGDKNFDEITALSKVEKKQRNGILIEESRNFTEIERAIQAQSTAVIQVGEIPQQEKNARQSITDEEKLNFVHLEKTFNAGPIKRRLIRPTLSLRQSTNPNSSTAIKAETIHPVIKNRT